MRIITAWRSRAEAALFEGGQGGLTHSAGSPQWRDHPPRRAGSRQRGTYPGTILSSHPDSENFQLPSNEQSTFDTSSQAGDHSGTLSRDASVPAAIMSLLGEINDIEQRISSEWAAEQQLRADEIASLPSVAEEPAPLRGPRSRFTPDDVVAAARDGMRTARAHRVASRELPELPPETSRTLPESPRDWEERAAELEEQLVEQRLESARERADMEAKLLATERQLALSARAAAASPQLSLHNGSDGCGAALPPDPAAGASAGPGVLSLTRRTPRACDISTLRFHACVRGNTWYGCSVV